MLSLRSLVLLLDEVESSSMSESLSVTSCCDVELVVQLLLGEHFAESSRISKLSSNGLNFWRFDVFDVRLQFSSESTLRRPYALRGGRWLFRSVQNERKKTLSLLSAKKIRNSPNIMVSFYFYCLLSIVVLIENKSIRYIVYNVLNTSECQKQPRKWEEYQR